jgi:hypothetical protein
MEPYPTFNIIWRHYISHKSKPAYREGRLYYQVENRVSPIALLSGIAIPEDIEPHNLLLKVPRLKKALGLKWTSGPEVDFLMALQAAHDDAAPHSNFRERMIVYLTEVAELYRINFQ